MKIIRTNTKTGQYRPKTLVETTPICVSGMKSKETGKIVTAGFRVIDETEQDLHVWLTREEIERLYDCINNV